MTLRTRWPGTFLSRDEKTRIEEAIAAAELKTSGEIRVMVSRAVKGDPLEAAKERFSRLKMQDTRERNGVLILVAVASRRFAILGDEGIHRFVGQEGWEHIRDGMAERFRSDDFGGGLTYAVTEVAKVLKAHFPWQSDDVNELPNQIVEE
ncbi:MAG TPA: TPM domain-containing protein [Deferrisomatales bacterium]|nr:TPM domain-containing protein [Deferrisomatales bacterium]